MAAARAKGEALVAATLRDPDAELKARLAALKARNAALDEKLAGIQQSLVRAERMPDLLRDVIARHPSVRLVALKSLPALGLAADGKPADDKHPAVLYRHGVEITLEGRFLDLYGYAQALEDSPWRFVWGGVRLSVKEWPTSRLTLTLYTLSVDPAWLAV
jgi:MSHA biogenesis protein MshJ